jgi:MSHA biogenesis protein MshO
MPRNSERPSFRVKAANATAGFTLVEMITVIAIIGVIAAAVAVFIRAPLLAYQDAERRAAVTDTADTAFAMLKRDLQTALPNSVRVTSAGAVFHLEFLQARTGGRYRAADPSPVPATGGNTCADTNGDGLADENVLQFGVPDACFTTLGAVPGLGTIVAGSDFVVVYNLGPNFSGADAYESGPGTGGNKSRIIAAIAGAGGENVITFQPTSFALESPGRRFHVIAGPVAYECDPGGGTLRRFSGYPIATAQPTPPAATPALLARRVTGCTIDYNQNATNAANQRVGVVSIWLRLADAGGAGTVNLFQQVQVSNAP